ncbi:MAG: adenylate kinase [Spirochaetia bacterium]|nr:adenylate kinase [Spirochaetia bacterium]
MNIIFLGPPGAGKGTIAALAKEVLSIPHISTGDIFRAAIKNETPLGKQVKSILASGELVPDALTIDLVNERLKEDDTSGGYILDGFPRTIPQAEALETFADIDFVINFTVERDMIIRRLSGRRIAKESGKVYHIIYNPPRVEGICDITGESLIQREDDKEEAVVNRLEVYERQTEPLIEYYTEKGLIRNVDGSDTPEKVLASFLAVIGVDKS